MDRLEAREPASEILRGRLQFRRGGGAVEEREVTVHVSVNFKHAEFPWPQGPTARYRAIMLEGAAQAGMSPQQVATIAAEVGVGVRHRASRYGSCVTLSSQDPHAAHALRACNTQCARTAALRRCVQAVPFVPERLAAERVTFREEGPQRLFTRAALAGQTHAAIFNGKVLRLDRADEAAMGERRAHLLGGFAEADLWRGRDCSTFLRNQFYNPQFGRPPVVPRLAAEYDAWLEDVAAGGMLRGYHVTGRLVEGERERAPPEEFPHLPHSMTAADQSGQPKQEPKSSL